MERSSVLGEEGGKTKGIAKGKGGQIVGRGLHLALGCRQSKTKVDLPTNLFPDSFLGQTADLQGFLQAIAK